MENKQPIPDEPVQPPKRGLESNGGIILHPHQPVLGESIRPAYGRKKGKAILTGGVGELEAGDIIDPSGIHLKEIRVTPPVAMVFTEEELDERIRLLSEKHMAGLRASIGTKPLSQHVLPNGINIDDVEIIEEEPTPSKQLKSLHVPEVYPITDGVRWGDVIVMTCAGCSKTVVSEKHEHLRSIVMRGKNAALKRIFPKPMGGRKNGRPYCAGCI